MIDLIERLRTARREERKDLARQFALTTSDEGLSELVRMVEGRLRMVKPRTVFTLWCKVPKSYGLCDQLIALECLGYTQRQEALEYLRWMSTPSEIQVDAFQEYGQGSDMRLEPCTVRAMVYPNSILNTSEEIGTGYRGTRPTDDQNAHRLLRDAITRLEQETILKNGDLDLTDSQPWWRGKSVEASGAGCFGFLIIGVIPAFQLLRVTPSTLEKCIGDPVLFIISILASWIATIGAWIAVAWCASYVISVYTQQLREDPKLD